MDPVGRFFLCQRCRAQTLVCSACDRGQMYCSSDCAQTARRPCGAWRAKPTRSWRCGVCRGAKPSGAGTAAPRRRRRSSAGCHPSVKPLKGGATGAPVATSTPWLGLPRAARTFRSPGRPPSGDFDGTVGRDAPSVDVMITTVHNTSLSIGDSRHYFALRRRQDNTGCGHCQRQDYCASLEGGFSWIRNSVVTIPRTT